MPVEIGKGFIYCFCFLDDRFANSIEGSNSTGHGDSVVVSGMDSGAGQGFTGHEHAIIHYMYIGAHFPEFLHQCKGPVAFLVCQPVNAFDDRGAMCMEGQCHQGWKNVGALGGVEMKSGKWLF